MNNYFECKVSYEKMMENGYQKKVTEPYLVDALSFTEAEARIIEEIIPFITGEFTVADIKRVKFSEIFLNDSGDRYYKFKVFYITLDEKSGSERKTAMQMLAQASDLKEAIEVFEKGMTGTMAEYEIVSVTETPLMDIFPYSSPIEKDAFTSDNIKATYNPDNKDPLFNEAVDLIIDSKTASISQLQKYFSIGYNRAGSLMNQLKDAGIVGQHRKNPSSLEMEILIHK